MLFLYQRSALIAPRWAGEEADVVRRHPPDRLGDARAAVVASSSPRLGVDALRDPPHWPVPITSRHGSPRSSARATPAERAPPKRRSRASTDRRARPAGRDTGTSAPVVGSTRSPSERTARRAASPEAPAQPPSMPAESAGAGLGSQIARQRGTRTRSGARSTGRAYMACPPNSAARSPANALYA